MFYVRETYLISPEKVNDFNAFFHEYLFSIYIKHGAVLVGRWVTELQNEVISIWEYPSYDEYVKIEDRVAKDEMYQAAQIQHEKIGPLFLEKRIDFLNATGQYSLPMQTVSVSGFITNEQNETLLVRTFWRADTWELPGGRVDDGETLDMALCREILEETGITVQLQGVTGVYSNGSTVAIVFLGKCTGGQVRTSIETKEVCFTKLDPANVLQYIKRGKYVPRVLDAMSGSCAPYEAFKVRPYQLLERLAGHDVME